MFAQQGALLFISFSYIYLSLGNFIILRKGMTGKFNPKYFLFFVRLYIFLFFIFFLYLWNIYFTPNQHRQRCITGLVFVCTVQDTVDWWWCGDQPATTGGVIDTQTIVHFFHSLLLPCVSNEIILVRRKHIFFYGWVGNY